MMQEMQTQNARLSGGGEERRAGSVSGSCGSAEESLSHMSDESLLHRVLEVHHDLSSKMMDFVSHCHGKECINYAFKEFCDLEEGEELFSDDKAKIFFMPWFLYRWRPSPDCLSFLPSRIIEMRMPPAQNFIWSEKGRDLSNLEKELIGAASESAFTFHRIMAVRGGVGLELKDMMSGEQYFVREKAASEHNAVVGHIVFAQVLSVQGLFIFGGYAPLLLGPHHEVRLTGWRREVLRESGLRALSHDDLLDREHLLFRIFWDIWDEVRGCSPPQFITPMAMSR